MINICHFPLKRTKLFWLQAKEHANSSEFCGEKEKEVPLITEVVTHVVLEIVQNDIRIIFTVFVNEMSILLRHSSSPNVIQEQNGILNVIRAFKC